MGLSTAVARLAVTGALPLPEATPLYLLTTKMCPPGPFYIVAACATSAAAIAVVAPSASERVARRDIRHLDVARDESQGGGSRDRDLFPGSAWTRDSEALITSWSSPSGKRAARPAT